MSASQLRSATPLHSLYGCYSEPQKVAKLISFGFINQIINALKFLTSVLNQRIVLQHKIKQSDPNKCTIFLFICEICFIFIQHTFLILVLSLDIIMFKYKLCLTTSVSWICRDTEKSEDIFKTS